MKEICHLLLAGHSLLEDITTSPLEWNEDPPPTLLSRPYYPIFSPQETGSVLLAKRGREEIHTTTCCKSPSFGVL
jgi:hypothetical protein